MRDLVNVEAIPFEVLNAGITWDWESFPEYMDAAARRKPARAPRKAAPVPADAEAVAPPAVDDVDDGLEAEDVESVKAAPPKPSRRRTHKPADEKE